MKFNFHTHKYHKCPILGGQSISTSLMIDSLFSPGIHPWYIVEGQMKAIWIIETKLQESNCLAIGECGLDKVEIR
jgi:TatD DNase family protein